MRIRAMMLTKSQIQTVPNTKSFTVCPHDLPGFMPDARCQLPQPGPLDQIAGSLGGLVATRRSTLLPSLEMLRIRRSKRVMIVIIYIF